VRYDVGSYVSRFIICPSAAGLGNFYGGSTITSVKLPTDPAAELSFSSGVRPSLSGIDFDFGFTYFLYPGEVSNTGPDYWEFAARADKKLTEKVRVAAGFAYSPNISNTGAWSKYTAAHLDLRYYDTNLSRENCFVFTGDTNARPGGRADPLTNPEGLTSGWCSATVVAKFWFTLD
jgi:Bacterial protein of unknown function (Gcw_chp)